MSKNANTDFKHNFIIIKKLVWEYTCIILNYDKKLPYFIYIKYLNKRFKNIDSWLNVSILWSSLANCRSLFILYAILHHFYTIFDYIILSLPYYDFFYWIRLLGEKLCLYVMLYNEMIHYVYDLCYVQFVMFRVLRSYIIFSIRYAKLILSPGIMLCHVTLQDTILENIDKLAKNYS